MRPTFSAAVFACSILVPTAARAEATLPERIREATRKATEALAKQVKITADGRLAADDGSMNPILIALTLLRAGGPKEREIANSAIDAWWKSQPPSYGTTSNYELAIAISALEATALERVEEPSSGSTRSRFDARPLTPENERRLEIAVRAMIEGRSRSCFRGSAWGYDTAPLRTNEAPRAMASLPRARAKGWDNSNTQFSVLALHDAARGGVRIPRELAEEIANHFVEFRREGLKVKAGAPGDVEGALRWGYEGTGSATVTMSLAGLSSLAIARELGARSPSIEKALQLGQVGLEQLVADVAVTGYDLYSLEKALDILEIEKVGDHEWFPPLASKLIAAQRADGLWGEVNSYDCLNVLFLVRATVGRSRVVDHRLGTSGAPVGEVFLSSKKKSVDAVAAVVSFGAATDERTIAARRIDATEAVTALVAEGHGREACLFDPLADLLARSGSKHELAARWLRDLAGRDLTSAEAGDAADLYLDLLRARVKKDLAPLKKALDDPATLLPLRAFAARALASVPLPEGASAVEDALERLASDRLFATAAGQRAARDLADALVALARVELPAIEAGKPLLAQPVVALARASRDGRRQAFEAAVQKGLAAILKSEQDPDAWKRAREALVALGRPALERLVALAAEPAHAKEAFAALRSVTGELVPDDVEAWKRYVASR